jgi:hypothetical protein
MAITLRYTPIDTTGKTSELTYQEMNENLKSFYYSSSFDSGTGKLDMHFLSGSTSHSIDLSSLAGAGSYISNASLVGTDLTFTGLGSAFNSTVDLSSLLDDTNTNIANTNLNLTGNRTLDLSTNNLSIDALSGETFTVTADNSATINFQLDSGDFKINGLPNTETPLVLGYNSSTGLVSYYNTGSFGGGSTSPGGSDGQVQYNNGGAFGGESTFTYDDTNNVLSIQGTVNGPAIKLLNSTPSFGAGIEFAELAARSAIYSADVANIVFKGDGAASGGDYPTRIEFGTTPDGQTVPTTKFQIKNNGLLIADEYGSGTFTGTATKWLAVDSSGNIIEEDAPTVTSSNIIESGSYSVDADAVDLYGLGDDTLSLSITYSGGTDKDLYLQGGTGILGTTNSGIIVAKVNINCTGLGSIKLRYLAPNGIVTDISGVAQASADWILVFAYYGSTRLHLISSESF